MKEERDRETKKTEKTKMNYGTEANEGEDKEKED